MKVEQRTLSYCSGVHSMSFFVNSLRRRSSRVRFLIGRHLEGRKLSSCWDTLELAVVLVRRLADGFSRARVAIGDRGVLVLLCGGIAIQGWHIVGSNGVARAEIIRVVRHGPCIIRRVAIVGRVYGFAVRARGVKARSTKV